MTWNLLHILTKGSQLVSIFSEYFKFLGFFPPPLFKSNLVLQGLYSPIKNIYIYIFQNDFALFEKSFSLI